MARLSATIVLAMSDSTQPRNEAVLSYAPGPPERAELVDALGDLGAQARDLPMRIGGKDHRGAGNEFSIRAPHNHEQNLGVAHQATGPDVQLAIDAAAGAAAEW